MNHTFLPESVPYNKDKDMNALVQHHSQLLGSDKDIAALADAEKAKLLVLSDSHGNNNVTESIIRGFGPDCQALIFTGDGIWDILNTIKTASADKNLFAALPPVIGLVRGNGDYDTYTVYSDNGNIPVQVAETQYLTAASHRVLFMHGHRHSVDFSTDNLFKTATANNADLVFFGHTHRPYKREKNQILMLNPGSCSRPRGNFPPTFAVVTVSKTNAPKIQHYAIEGSLFSGFTYRETEITSSLY